MQKLQKLLKQAQHKTASNGNTGCGFFMLQHNAFHTYTVYKKMIIINIKSDQYKKRYSYFLNEHF